MARHSYSALMYGAISNALLTKHGGLQATLITFDLLRFKGDDLRQRMLEKRREALMRRGRR